MDSLETSIDEDCVYACPNKDVLPVKKPSYNPHPDGCNLIGLNIGRMLTVEINECCKAHGACYETCNNSKDQCDQDLKRCLYKYCEDFGENSTDEHTQSKSCHGVAKMLYAQQIALGCRSYLDSQARACDCQGKRKIKL
ncbi:group XIIA secretory phospholipase A2-like [Sabethes cyaneus]|uniref:group XIIA secretory phospholipase A2-like n=1 Tax=Sabethes cyaneus TaxID=53552 RepID=UPI00237DE7D2|nr:group XIIA secretory phospholipase A2-like [Sabethes cyaneus]